MSIKAEPLSLNLTIFGDPQSGKSSLLKALAGLTAEEELKRDFYPLKTRDADGPICLNMFESTNSLHKVPKTAERLLMSDLFIFCASYAEKEDEFMLANFPRTNEQDIKVKKHLYNSVFQMLLQFTEFYDLTERLVIVFTKCESEIADTCNDKIGYKKSKWSGYLANQGVPLEHVPIVATSALSNTNILTKGEIFTAEYSLLDVIVRKAQAIRDARSKVMQERFRVTRFSVAKVYKKLGAGIVAEGFNLGDRLKVGEPVLILPANKESTVAEIQSFGQKVDECYKGGAFGINLKGINLCDLGHGSVVCRPSDINTQFVKIETMLVHLHFLYAFNFIQDGFVMALVGYNTRVPVVIEKIKKTIDFETVTNEWEYGNSVIGTMLVAKLKLLKPAVLERANEFPELGRFALVGSNVLYAYGSVEAINPA